MSDVTPPRSWARRFFSLVGWFHYWFVLVAVLLLALVKGLAEPLLLEPAVERALKRAADGLAQRLGEEVGIDFGEAHVTFGLKGMYLVVTEPGVTVSGRSVSASEAALAIRPDELPVLVVREARLRFEVGEDGTVSLAGIPLRSLEGLLGDGGGADGMALPSSFVAADADVSFSFADGERLELPPITAALRPEEELGRLVMSLRSGIADPLKFRGRVHIPIGEGAAGPDFYLSATGLESALLQLGVRAGVDRSRLEVWGSVGDDGTVEAVAAASATGMTHSASLQGGEFALPDSALEVGTLGISALGTRAASGGVALRWVASARDVSLRLPEDMLGAEVTVSTLEGGGSASFGAGVLSVEAGDMRFLGPVGTGSFDLAVDAGGGTLDVDLRGSAPVMDVGRVTGLLPLSLSERGVPFLRNDLDVSRAQLLTIVVSGSDFGTFPWKDGEDGTFGMQVDFFDASLDYADGYPPLAGATGGFGLSGAALAVTVIGGSAGPAQLGIGRAGVDDLDANVSTLFVALDAELPDGALEPLLRTLPATSADAAPVLAEFTPSGAQSLNLALVINLDEDVPVGVDGALEVHGDNSVTHIPSGIVVDDLAGSFNFSNSGVGGIATGSVLDAGVRISVGFRGSEAELLVEGNFDLAAVAAQLGEDLPVGLEGSSPVSLRAGPGGLLVRSNLLGTAVDLPLPFGKTAERARETSLLISGDLLRLEYGLDFAKAVARVGSDPVAVSFGPGPPPSQPPERGVALTGELSGLDVDSLAGLSDLGGGGDLGDGYVADVTLRDATLLGLSHPEILLVATVAATVTVAAIESDAIKGVVRLSGATVFADMERMSFPDDDVNPSDLGDDATIYVEPGALSPELPPLTVRIAELAIGERNYQGVEIGGRPAGGTWILEGLRAMVGNNVVTASGDTNTAGDPRSEVTLKVDIPDLPGFFANYSKESSDDNSILGGSGEISGSIAWRGALNDPHPLSMTGSLGLSGRDVVISEDSSGARLLNLLSPFTILQALPNFSLGDDKTLFNSASGRMSFSEGDLVVEEIYLVGNDVDFRINGRTNLVTERNDLRGAVVIKSSDNVTTGAVTFVNPLAGALLLVFDKVLDAPLIGDLELQYDIGGTWDEPEITQVGAAEQAQ